MNLTYKDISDALKKPKPSPVFSTWLKDGSLEESIPELAKLKGVTQDKKWHPEGDVWNHTMRAVDFYRGDIIGRWAILFHDLGKATTRKVVNGEPTFPEHARESVKMARAIMKRLKMPQRAQERIIWLISVHNDYYKLLEDDVEEIKKIVKHPDFDLYMRVALADEGSRGRNPVSWIESVKRLKGLIRTGGIEKEKVEIPEQGKPLLNKGFGFSPKVSEVQLGDVNHRHVGFISPSGSVVASQDPAAMHIDVSRHIVKNYPTIGKGFNAAYKNREVRDPVSYLLSNGWTRFSGLKDHRGNMSVHFHTNHPQGEESVRKFSSKMNWPFQTIYHDNDWDENPKGRRYAFVAPFEDFLKHGHNARSGDYLYVKGIEPPKSLVKAFLGDSRGERPSPHDFGANNKVQSHPDYMYHATTEDRAYDIAGSGLSLHKPWEHTDQSVWPDGSTDKRNYFSDKAHATWSFIPEGNHGVILRVPKSSHPFKRESTGDFYSTKPVHHSKIEMLSDSGSWHPIRNFYPEEDFKKSYSPKPMEFPVTGFMAITKRDAVEFAAEELNKSLQSLLKGAAAQIGEIHRWKDGNLYQKQAHGWVPVRSSASDNWQHDDRRQIMPHGEWGDHSDFYESASPVTGPPEISADAMDDLLNAFGPMTQITRAETPPTPKEPTPQEPKEPEGHPEVVRSAQEIIRASKHTKSAEDYERLGLPVPKEFIEGEGLHILPDPYDPGDIGNFAMLDPQIIYSPALGQTKIVLRGMERGDMGWVPAKSREMAVIPIGMNKAQAAAEAVQYKRRGHKGTASLLSFFVDNYMDIDGIKGKAAGFFEPKSSINIKYTRLEESALKTINSDEFEVVAAARNGVNAPRFVKWNNEMQAVVKTSFIGRTAKLEFARMNGNIEHGHPANEAAAFRLSKLVKFECVPATEYFPAGSRKCVPVKGGDMQDFVLPPHSMQELIPDAKHYEDVSYLDVDTKEMAEMSVLDCLTMNVDRHGQNIMVDPDGTAFAIDNAGTLSTDYFGMSKTCYQCCSSTGLFRRRGRIHAFNTDQIEALKNLTKQDLDYHIGGLVCHGKRGNDETKQFNSDILINAILRRARMVGEILEERNGLYDKDTVEQISAKLSEFDRRRV